ncbi:MAG: hypothetical protein MSA47_03335 [Christensenellaceae bacterium]|nr:hypothetical protein [Christensenellaceae bacterium]
MRIAFVCTGNTCRSPMAEAIFRFYAKEKGLDNVEVSSYGLRIDPNERVTSDKAVKAVKNIGIPIRAKKAKAVTENVINTADYVIVMTEAQKKILPYENVFTFDSLTGGGDIPDPYGEGQDAYDATAFRLKLAIQNLINDIAGGKL